MILATIISAYMLIGLAVAILDHATSKVSRERLEVSDIFIGYLLCLFGWPLAFSPIIDNLKSWRKITKQTQLFKGVDKPSYILAQMLAQKILMHPEKVSSSEWRFEGYVVGESYYKNYVEVRTPSGKFTYKEGEDKVSLNILVKALDKAREIGEKRRVAEKEAKKESEALEAIEGLMGLKQPPDSKVKDCEFSCCNPEAKRKLLEKQRKGL